MTATTRTELRKPPRSLIRLFWKLHRFAHRVTGGRFGLSNPEADKGMGMLRISTTGRRSGKRRETILGYYEDGANLVTLAMNGWGTTDPAWWLNLQASPEAVVDLPGGRRTVHARAAEGAERDRLWATFARYPGWGTDLEGLAATRSVPTTIVIFEPVSDAEAVAS